jgi:hypothetical protein
MLVACWFAACSGSASTHSAITADHANAGTSAADDADDDFKGCPAQIPAFGPGLRAVGDHYALKLLAAMPDQPERYSDNDWTVELATLDGSSASDAQIVRGQTFMPIHGHDGRVEPAVKALATPGQFQVDRLNFSMRGPWEVRLWLDSASLAEDYLVFQVCVTK